MRLVRNIFLLMALFLVAAIAIMYRAGTRATQSSSKVVDAQATIDRLKDALSTLKDAETGQRGYLLTGNPTDLDPYNAAVARIGQDLQTLESLPTSGNL